MSTDIAESLPKRKFAPAAMMAKSAKQKVKHLKVAVKKKHQQQKVVVKKVRLKKVQRREFVRQYMILDIVQEEKILILKQRSLSICQIVH